MDVPLETKVGSSVSSVQRVVLMLSLSLVVLVLAIVMHDLTIGFSVVACSSGMAVCFIIPGALYDAALVAQRLDRGVPISTFDTKRYAPLRNRLGVFLLFAKQTP